MGANVERAPVQMSVFVVPLVLLHAHPAISILNRIYKLVQCGGYLSSPASPQRTDF